MKHLLSTTFSICIAFTLVITAQPLRQIQDNSSRTTHGNKPKSGERPLMEYLNPKGGSNLPFSDAVRVGDWLILSGKIGTDSSGKLVIGGIKAETKQTMENIRSALDAYGSSLDQVIKCTVMLADIKEWGEMNEVYTTYFKKERLPARSALGANGLALGARVEIECWAVMKKTD